jgi:predicted Zn-dependent protease
MSGGDRSRLLFERATDRIRHGDLDSACDLLHQLLAEDPDDARAHALLSVCLVDRKLVGPALVEAEAAMACDPDAALSHYAMGGALLADRKLDAAATHLQRAIELEPDESIHYLRLAELHRLRGQPREALLQRALDVDPEDPDVLAALAMERLDSNRTDEAERFATEALELDPESHDALLAMGWVRLHQADVADAREHAAMALHQAPNDDESLRLLIAIKARKNPFLGLWFRWNLWMSTLGDRRGVIVLVAAFMIYRVLAAIAEDFDREDVAAAIRYLWLGLVAYTWVAPVVFRRMLEKEIARIQLHDDY